jgi:hypothetical protein
MPFSFWNETSQITGTGTLTPTGPWPGGSGFVLTAIDNTNLSSVSANDRAKSKNFTSNPSAGNCLIITPGPEDGIIRVYAFTTTSVLTNLWQVPTPIGPLVPIGTTFNTINEVVGTCTNEGCIYFDQNGPDVTP